MLLQQKPDAPVTLRSTLLEISSPSSSRYGKFMSIDEIVDIVKPEMSTLQPVVKFFSDMGVSVEFNKYSDALTTTMPAALVNSIFSARMSVYTDENGNTHIRSDRRHVIPSALLPHVDAVAGIHEPFPLHSNVVSRKRPQTSSPTVPCLYEPGPTPCCLATE